MKLPGRFILATLALVVAAGTIGGWAGVQYGLERVQPAGLHERLHEELDLTAEQERKIHALEVSFAAERETHEASMRAANAELAAAIMTHSPDRERAHRAVQRFHLAMGALQTATIEHVLAMRAVLSREQAVKYDEIVAKALIAETR